MPITPRHVDMYNSAPEPFREALVAAWIIHREMSRSEAHQAGWLTPHMIQDYREDNDYAVQFQRILEQKLDEQIGALASKPLSELIVRQIEGSEDQRARLTLAIGTKPEDEATVALRTLLNDGMALVRAAAAWCLAKRPGKDLSIELVKMLKDDDRRVRVLVHKAILRRFGENLGTEPEPYLAKLETE